MNRLYKTVQYIIHFNAVQLSIIFRYLELVYPFWHKAHFKMTYLYTAIALCWTLGIGLNAAYMIPTGKVFLLAELHENFLENYIICDNMF